jgi:hypothetical protein
LVYIADLVDRGIFDEKEFEACVRANAERHGHGRFQALGEWKEELPYIIRKFGWRVFDAGRFGGGRIEGKGDEGERG